MIPVVTNRDHADVKHAMRLSVAAGIIMLALKFAAYGFTGSSAILSDAIESIVHIMAVLFAAFSLWVSLKPADEQHPYGHAKISFFSAGAEGALIIAAAAVIMYTAAREILAGPQVKNLDVGVGFTVVAAGINAALGWYLVRVGRRKKSLILEANGLHVLTDSWTSAGVVAGLLLALATDWLLLDPLCAIAVAVNIVFSGFKLIRRSVGGLMDQADPVLQRDLTNLLDKICRERGISHHLLRQRFNGSGHDVDLHLVFPDAMPIKEAHRMATDIEGAIKNALPGETHVTTHLEPEDDHRNMHPNSPHYPKVKDP